MSVGVMSVVSMYVGDDSAALPDVDIEIGDGH